MKVFRTKYTLKGKEWFSDWPYEFMEASIDPVDSRIAWDIIRYLEMTGKDISEFPGTRIFKLVRRFKRASRNNKLGWLMEDYGLVKQ